MISWLNFLGFEATATNNTIMGCEPVTVEECGECWAPFQVVRQQKLPGRAGLTVRDEAGQLTWSGRVQMFEDRVDAPLGWKQPTVIFQAAMGDMFHAAVPMPFVARHWAVASLTPRHIHIVFTKRHHRLHETLSDPRFVVEINRWRERLQPGSGPCTYPAPNVIVGVSAGTQTAANLRVPYLMRTPAAVRAVSVEPQSTAVDLAMLDAGHGRWADALSGQTSAGPAGRVDWVISGGKATTVARSQVGKLDLAWARALRDQCAERGVAFHFKQLGTGLAADLGATKKGHDPAEWPADMRVRQYPEVSCG